MYFDSKSNDEFIEDGKNGLLFEIENPNQLVEKIIKLAEDKTLVKQLAENVFQAVMNTIW